MHYGSLLALCANRDVVSYWGQLKDDGEWSRVPSTTAQEIPNHLWEVPNLACPQKHTCKRFRPIIHTFVTITLLLAKLPCHPRRSQGDSKLILGITPIPPLGRLQMTSNSEKIFYW